MSLPTDRPPLATLAPLGPGATDHPRRRRQHRLPAGRIAAREVATDVGVAPWTLLRRIAPRDDAPTLEHWTRLLDIRAVPSRGHFMFTFDAERVRAHLAELRAACGRAELSIADARSRTDARDDGWGGRRRNARRGPPGQAAPTSAVTAPGTPRARRT